MDPTKYISANPGQTINLFVQQKGIFIDGYIPVVKNIFDKNMNALPGFPTNMSLFPDGYNAYYYPFAIPTGNAGVGTYTAEVLLQSVSSQDLTNDSNYFNEIIVSSSNFNTTPSVSFSFQPTNFIFICTSGNVTFSFDGVNTNGVMSQLAPLNTLYFNDDSQKNIWFSGSGSVLVYAYQNINSPIQLKQNGSNDLNYFKQSNVSSVGFNSSADISLPFKSTNLIFICSSGNITFSFDGVNTNGMMSQLAPLNTLYFSAKTQTNIWLAGSGSLLVYAYAPSPGAACTSNEYFIINSIKPFGISAVIGG